MLIIGKLVGMAAGTSPCQSRSCGCTLPAAQCAPIAVNQTAKNSPLDHEQYREVLGIAVGSVIVTQKCEEILSPVLLKDRLARQAEW